MLIFHVELRSCTSATRYNRNQFTGVLAESQGENGENPGKIQGNVQLHRDEQADLLYKEERGDTR